MFLDLITKRRSIRKYKNNPIELEKIEILKEVLLRSPSSRSRNPWEFFFITDKAILEKLSVAKAHSADFIKDAALGIVITGDPAVCDVWIEDCSIATAFLLLAAEDLGLGACWIQIRERFYNKSTTSEQYVSEVLSLPENLKVLSMVALGYPDEQLPPKKKSSLPAAKIHENTYPKS